MSRTSQSAAEAADDADSAQTARRMVRALDYLMRVASAAGLPKVTAKLAVAQAELLLTAGSALIEVKPGKARHDASRRSH